MEQINSETNSETNSEKSLHANFEKNKKVQIIEQNEKTVEEEMTEIIKEETEYNDVLEKDQEYEEHTFVGENLIIQTYDS